MDFKEIEMQKTIAHDKIKSQEKIINQICTTLIITTSVLCAAFVFAIGIIFVGV